MTQILKQGLDFGRLTQWREPAAEEAEVRVNCLSNLENHKKIQTSVTSIRLMEGLIKSIGQKDNLGTLCKSPQD